MSLSGPVEPARASRRAGTSATRAVTAAARDPIVWIFFLAGIFEVLTGDPIAHGTLLFVVAATLAVDATTRRARKAPPAGQRADAHPSARIQVPVRIVTACIVVYALAGASFTRYTWPMTIVVGVPALAGVAWAWRAPERSAETKPLDRAGAAVWVALFVCLALWELRELLLQPSLTTGSDANPTISRLLDPALGVWSGRFVGLLVWLGLGRFLIGAAS